MKAKLLIIIIALASTSVFAQDKLADKFYKNYAYIKASELYEKAVEKGDSSAHVLTRLGDCYYNNSNSEKAAKWYGLAVEKYDDIDALVLFKYIQTLQSLGQYEEANNYRIAYNQRVEKKVAPGFDELMSFFQLNTDTERVYVDVQNSEFNSSYSDFGGYTANGKMYIASARPNEATAGDKIYKWNEQPFLDIYEVPVKEVDGKTAFGAMAPISAEDVNTPYHEGTVAVTADGKKIFFTRDNVTRRKKLDYDKSGTTHLKIYKASIDNDSWSDIEELPFNSEAHSIGHPALSPDNKRLYFVSDMDGGFGATDLYYVDITEEDGEITYSAPVNMGPKINTEGREMFPFIAKDSTLYFSSDGHLNLGLLDIFKSDILKDDDAEVENLGAPYNSGYDDFAFYIGEDGEKGFFSSNRQGGQGNDDVYGFYAYECQQAVRGVVRDKKDGSPIAGATVEIINKNSEVVLETVTTDASGAYAFDINCETEYILRGSKTGYRDDTQSFRSTAEHSYVHNYDLNLEPLIVGCEISLRPIFFDFDKWNIRTDAQYELEKVVDILRDYPDMIIKIESHTDSRGTDKYNERLSDRRAKSTRDYILSRGIETSRIESAIGYGESVPLIKQDSIRKLPNRKAKEDAHQMNRRSKFIIVNCEEAQMKKAQSQTD